MRLAFSPVLNSCAELHAYPCHSVKSTTARLNVIESSRATGCCFAAHRARLGCTCRRTQRQISQILYWHTYRSSFSMRSTCVSIMRRQQYLFSPSSSIASLRSCVLVHVLHVGLGPSSSSPGSVPVLHHIAVRSWLVNELHVALVEVRDDLR